MEGGKANQHDNFRIGHRQLNRLFDARRLARAVIVRDNRHHAVVHAENRHEDKRL